MVSLLLPDRLDDALQPKIEALKSLMEKLQEPLAGLEA